MGSLLTDAAARDALTDFARWSLARRWRAACGSSSAPATVAVTQSRHHSEPLSLPRCAFGVALALRLAESSQARSTLDAVSPPQRSYAPAPELRPLCTLTAALSPSSATPKAPTTRDVSRDHQNSR